MEIDNNFVYKVKVVTFNKSNNEVVDVDDTNVFCNQELAEGYAKCVINDNEGSDTCIKVNIIRIPKRMYDEDANN